MIKNQNFFLEEFLGWAENMLALSWKLIFQSLYVNIYMTESLKDTVFFCMNNQKTSSNNIDYVRLKSSTSFKNIKCHFWPSEAESSKMDLDIKFVKYTMGD